MKNEILTKKITSSTFGAMKAYCPEVNLRLIIIY